MSRAETTGLVAVERRRSPAGRPRDAVPTWSRNMRGTNGDRTRAIRTSRRNGGARWETLPADRAKASVFTSVTPAPVGNPNPLARLGLLSPTTSTCQRRSSCRPARLSDISGRIQQFSPVKIGYLIDIDAGAGLSDSLDTVYGMEARLNDGELKRPIEIIPLVARGLPREDAAVTVAGYQALCDAGCLVILGPYITDNGMALLAAPEPARRR